MLDFGCYAGGGSEKSAMAGLSSGCVFRGEGGNGTIGMVERKMRMMR